MKQAFKFLWIFAILLLILPPAARSQQPPIIDRELFFGDPEISGAQISPDGKYIAFLKPLNRPPRRARRSSSGSHL